MIKTESVIIDSNEYVIQTFDAIKGNKILFTLIKYLRGGTSLFDEFIKDKGSSKNIENLLDSDLSISLAIEKIMATIDPEDMTNLMLTMFKNVTYENSPLTEDFVKGHFAGNYLSMYKLAAAIIKINYINEATLSFFAQTRQKLNSQTGKKTEKATKDTQEN